MLWLGVDCRRSGCRRCGGIWRRGRTRCRRPGCRSLRLSAGPEGKRGVPAGCHAAGGGPPRGGAGGGPPGRGLPPERVRAVLDQLAAGLNPNQARPAAGVSESFVYRLHHTMGGAYRRYGGNQLLGPHAAGLGGTETVQVTR